MKRQFFVSDAVKQVATKALTLQGEKRASIPQGRPSSVDEVAVALSKFIENRQRANSIPHEVFVEKISI